MSAASVVKNGSPVQPNTRLFPGGAPSNGIRGSLILDGAFGRSVGCTPQDPFGHVWFLAAHKGDRETQGKEVKYGMNFPPEATERKYSNVIIRAAETGDLEAILQLLDSAFAPSKFESGLVKALLVGGRSIQHWILEKNREVMGYVCYSRAYRDREVIGWHLAPVAVSSRTATQGMGR